MLPNNSTFDICIVGAGVVGASLAAYARRFPNLKIALIDMNFNYQDRIVGELLQPAGLDTLSKLGLQDCVNTIDAQPVLGYALFHKDQHFSLPYSLSDNDFIPEGRGIVNGKFIQALRKEAAANENVTLIKGRVQTLLHEDERVVGVSFMNEEGEQQEVLAQQVIASDGFFSKLRKGIHTVTPEVTSYFIGLVLKDIYLPYKQYGHIITSNVANVLCYKIDECTTRILIDYNTTSMPAKDEAFKTFILEEVCEILPAEIQTAYKEQVKVKDLKFMPNHYLPAKMNNRPEGLILLGDALNMRHPLTGGGMTVALKDVYHFADCLEFFGSNEFENKVVQFYKDRSNWSSTVNILADALYKVVKNEKLRVACFDYLSNDNEQYKEPIAILAGVNTNRLDLLKHFLAVAIDGSLNAKGEEKIKDKFLHSKDIIADASKIILPLLKNEMSWLR